MFESVWSVCNFLYKNHYKQSDFVSFELWYKISYNATILVQAMPTIMIHGSFSDSM